MPRRLRILDEHADLCSLIERWVLYQFLSVCGGLGYPRKSLDFSYKSSPASSIDPTGYAVQDHRDIEAAMKKLAETDIDLYAAVKMYYMPWTIRGLQADGYPFAPDQTYYNRLQRAHRWLSSEMRDILHRRHKKAA